VLAALVMAAVLLCAAPGCGKAKEPETEVVVIGTLHFITDMPEGYTPGHLRVLLKKVSPDVLAVEAPANAPSPWAYAPFELWNVTRPWAAKEGIECFPAGFNNPQYQAQLARMFQASEADGKGDAYRKIEQAFQTASAKQPCTCEFANGEAQYALWRDYHTRLHDLYGKDTPWETWNARIVENIVAICKKHPGERVAVVFGSAHAYYFVDHLARSKGIRVIPAHTFFPLSDAEVQAHTQPVDYLKALRQLNFDPGALPAQTIQRLESFLEQAERFPQFGNDCRLFRGKLSLHKGKWQDALQQFEALSNLEPQVVSAFDGQTRIREAAMVFAAVAKIHLERHAEAREELEAMLDDEQVTPGTKQWARQILATLPEETDSRGE
jgi:tetratricopeptide (TPR) repeat protein